MSKGRNDDGEGGRWTRGRDEVNNEGKKGNKEAKEKGKMDWKNEGDFEGRNSKKGEELRAHWFLLKAWRRNRDLVLGLFSAADESTLIICAAAFHKETSTWHEALMYSLHCRCAEITKSRVVLLDRGRLFSFPTPVSFPTSWCPLTPFVTRATPLSLKGPREFVYPYLPPPRIHLAPTNSSMSRGPDQSTRTTPCLWGRGQDLRWGFPLGLAVGRYQGTRSPPLWG